MRASECINTQLRRGRSFTHGADGHCDTTDVVIKKVADVIRIASSDKTIGRSSNGRCAGIPASCFGCTVKAVGVFVECPQRGLQRGNVNLVCYYLACQVAARIVIDYRFVDMDFDCGRRYFVS